MLYACFYFAGASVILILGWGNDHCAYLLTFHVLFGIVNLAPKSSSLLDSSCHLLLSDVSFLYPGVHIKENELKHSSSRKIFM